MTFDPLVPRDAQFLGQQEFQCRVSPRRRGLLIEQDDVEQARRAFRSATSVWGGARNPVLPVSEGVVVDGWIQLAQVLGVEEVADFTEDGSRQPGWSDGAAHGLAVIPAKGQRDRRFWSPSPLSVTDVSRPVRELLVPSDDSLLSLAGAGRHASPEDLADFRTQGWNIYEDAPPRLLASGQVAQRTLNHATLDGERDTELLDPLLASMAVLWVVDEADSFEDAVWFWNVRAARPRTSWSGGVDVFTTLDVVRMAEFRDEFAAAVQRTSRSTPSMLLASLTVSEDELRDLGSLLGAEEHTGSKLQERFGGEDASASPLTFQVNQDPIVHWTGGRKHGQPRREVVQLRRPSIEVSFESPYGWTPGYVLSGKVQVDISSPAIDGPRSAVVAGLFHRDGRWAGDALRLTSNNVPSYSFAIEIPTPAEVLKAAVQPSGRTFVRSDKGQQVMGAVGRDPDLAFYRQLAVSFVVARLTAKVGRDLARELAELRTEGKADEPAIERLRTASLLGSRPARTVADLRSEAASAGLDKMEVALVLDELVRRGAAEIGLLTVCGVCTLNEFQHLAAITNGAVCPGCGSRASFAADSHGAPQIHYRLNSLIHTLSLNGGMAPLAAMAILTSEDAYVDPGVNLYAGDSRIGEVDLLGWRGASLFAGECKMSAAGYAAADIERDVQLAVEIGADTYVAVCAEPLLDGIRSELETRTSALGLRLRILDQAVLFLN